MLAVVRDAHQAASKELARSSRRREEAERALTESERTRVTERRAAQERIDLLELKLGVVNTDSFAVDN